MTDENEVKALTERLHATANFRIGPLTIGDIAREALRWRDETRPVQAPPAAAVDAEEDAYVIERMGKLLAEIAIIVNGPEPPLTRWSYHDLPAKVRQIKERSDSGFGPEVARVVYEQVDERTWRWYVNWIDNNLPNGTLLFAQRPAVESEAQGG